MRSIPTPKTPRGAGLTPGSLPALRVHLIASPRRSALVGIALVVALLAALIGGTGLTDARWAQTDELALGTVDLLGYKPPKPVTPGCAEDEFLNLNGDCEAIALSCAYDPELAYVTSNPWECLCAPEDTDYEWSPVASPNPWFAQWYPDGGLPIGGCQYPTPPETDLAVSKTVSGESLTPLPDPLIVGSYVIYTITVSNSVPGEYVNNATVIDRLPPELTFAGTDTISYNEETGVWLVGSLAPGQSKTLHIRALTTVAGVVVNTATVSTDISDPNGANNISSATILVEWPSEIVDLCSIPSYRVANAAICGCPAGQKVADALCPGAGGEQVPCTVCVPLVPELQITKTATVTVPGGSATAYLPGTSIPGRVSSTYTSAAFTIVVTNNGETPLTLTSLDDDILGLSSPLEPTLNCPGGAPSSLSPVILGTGQSLTCTKNWTITDWEIQRGVHENIATVTTAELGAASVALTIPLNSPSISVTKRLATIGETGATKSYLPGSEVSYLDTLNFEYVVTNTGVTTLTGIALTDMVATDGQLRAVSCPATTLTAGASMTCLFTWVVTREESAVGLHSNTAAVTVAENVGGSSVTVNVPVTEWPIMIHKNAPDGTYKADDVVTFTYTLANHSDSTSWSLVSLFDNKHYADGNPSALIPITDCVGDLKDAKGNWMLPPKPTPSSAPNVVICTQTMQITQEMLEDIFTDGFEEKGVYRNRAIANLESTINHLQLTVSQESTAEWWTTVDIPAICFPVWDPIQGIWTCDPVTMPPLNVIPACRAYIAFTTTGTIGWTTLGNGGGEYRVTAGSGGTNTQIFIRMPMQMSFSSSDVSPALLTVSFPQAWVDYMFSGNLQTGANGTLRIYLGDADRTTDYVEMTRDGNNWYTLIDFDGASTYQPYIHVEFQGNNSGSAIAYAVNLLATLFVEQPDLASSWTAQAYTITPSLHKNNVTTCSTATSGNWMFPSDPYAPTPPACFGWKSGNPSACSTQHWPPSFPSPRFAFASLDLEPFDSEVFTETEPGEPVEEPELSAPPLCPTLETDEGDHGDTPEPESEPEEELPPVVEETSTDSAAD